MFKAWLRDLPDEVFPKALQHKITSSIPNVTEQKDAPQILKSELSNLPPFNYYLLFAVTAHITMLLNASKENKMSFHNLCVCFMPAMKMEMPCFSWLILDWKNCWEGCATERDYLEREYAMQDRRKSEGDDGDSEGRSRPVQHFDRYLPRNGSQQNSNASETSASAARPSTSYTAKSSSTTAGHDFSAPPLPLSATNGNRGVASTASAANTLAETPLSNHGSDRPTASPKRSNQEWKALDSVPSGSSAGLLARRGSDPNLSSAKPSAAKKTQESAREEASTTEAGRSARQSSRPQGIAQPDRSKSHYDGNFGEMRTRSSKESKKSRSQKDSSSKFKSLAAVDRETTDRIKTSEVEDPELSPLKPMSPFGRFIEL
jgi:hypothetical protein